MPCQYPITPFRARAGGITFDVAKSIFAQTITLPCGQCVWCRFVRTRTWALRCYLEAQQHDASAFVTLTYNPENLPENGTLVKAHVQKFIKRLRSNLEYENPELRIRFYLSGEYGEKTSRPHYHAIIFGYGFPDKYFYKKSPKGHNLYRSPFLEKCWKLGHSDIGDVELNSAAYVAGYIRKKINGDKAEEHYQGRLPEFSLQSSSPGIGADWYHANKHWLWKEDQIQCAGRTYRPPRYFEKLLKRDDPEAYAELQLKKRDRVPFKSIFSHEGAEELPDDDQSE